MKSSGWIVVVVCAVAFCSCSNKSKKQETQMEIKSQTVEVADSMVYGTCGEGTAMHTVELVGADGKSCSFTLNGGAKESGRVLGGLNVGDSLAVLSRHKSEGMPFAEVVVNVTSLADRWVSLNQTLILYKDGKAITKEKESKPVVSWKLFNGHLVVGKDTFAIRTIGSDSLYLVKGQTVTGYRRMSE